LIAKFGLNRTDDDKFVGISFLEDFYRIMSKIASCFAFKISLHTGILKCYDESERIAVKISFFDISRGRIGKACF